MAFQKFLNSLSPEDLHGCYEVACGMALANILSVENGAYEKDSITCNFIDAVFRNTRNHCISKVGKEDVVAFERNFIEHTNRFRGKLKAKLKSFDDLDNEL